MGREIKATEEDPATARAPVRRRPPSVSVRLRESEARYRSLTELSSDWYWEEDADFRLIEVSGNAFPQTGSSPATRMGKTRWELSSIGLTEAQWQAHRARVQAHLPFRDLEYGRPIAGGEYVWMSISGEPIFDPRGVFRGYRGVGRNITAHKRIEAEIRALNDELTRRVAELERANREMQGFNYTISHDLRAPLRALDGYSRLLLEECAGSLEGRGREFAERISANAQQMSRLIDDLLHLSRTTRAEMHPAPVDLSACAAEVAESLLRRDPQRPVSVAVAPGLTAQGDAVLLRLLLHNLLDNAWKFTARSGRPEIEFGARRGDGSLAYYVHDNGEGFDMAYAGKLFRPFERLHGADRFPGSGIGLATAQRIVERHGGQIWAEGAPGRGATFFFTLG